MRPEVPALAKAYVARTELSLSLPLSLTPSPLISFSLRLPLARLLVSLLGSPPPRSLPLSLASLPIHLSPSLYPPSLARVRFDAGAALLLLI